MNDVLMHVKIEVSKARYCVVKSSFITQM